MTDSAQKFSKTFTKALTKAFPPLLAVLPTLSPAQSMTTCDWTTQSAALSADAMTFANGAISVGFLDLGGGDHARQWLMIEHPSGTGEALCTLISFAKDQGFAMIRFAEDRANYDPARGLTLRFDTIFVLPEQNFQNSMRLEITINQATGEVDLVSQVGPG